MPSLKPAKLNSRDLREQVEQHLEAGIGEIVRHHQKVNLDKPESTLIVTIKLNQNGEQYAVHIGHETKLAKTKPDSFMAFAYVDDHDQPVINGIRQESFKFDDTSAAAADPSTDYTVAADRKPLREI